MNDAVRPAIANMLGLKHFVLRSEARKLYRDVLRAIKDVDADTAAGVRLAAREQFASNAHETDIDREPRLVAAPAPRYCTVAPLST